MSISNEVLREKLKKYFDDRQMNPTVQDQEIVAGSWGLKKQFVAMTKQDRKDRQNAVMLKDREERRGNITNQQRALAFELAKKRNQVIGNGPGEIRLDSAVELAELERSEEAKALAAAKQDAYELQRQEDITESMRVNQILDLPYRGQFADLLREATKISQNVQYYNDLLSETSAEKAAIEFKEGIAIAYERFPIDCLCPLNPPEKITPQERSLMARFMASNELDPTALDAWSVTWRILVNEKIMRPPSVPRIKVSFDIDEIHPLPVVPDKGPQNPHKAGTLEAQQWDRDEAQSGALDERLSAISPFIQEIADASSMAIPNSLALAVYDDLKAKNLAPTRYNTRRSFAYLRAGEIPANVYDQSELDQFEADRAEQAMTADEYKKLNYRRSLA